MTLSICKQNVSICQFVLLPTAGSQGLPGTGRTCMAKLWTHPLFYRSWIAWLSVALQCLLPKLHTRFCVVSRETDRSVASRQASLRAAVGRCSGPRCLHSLCKHVFQTPKLQAVLAFIKRSWLRPLDLVELLFACFRTAVAACGLL